MGLLDIHEEKILDNEYFINTAPWVKSWSSASITTYHRSMMVDAELNSTNNHGQKIGTITFNYHLYSNGKGGGGCLQIYYIPHTYHYLTAESGKKYDKFNKYIGDFLRPFATQAVTDVFSLNQIIDGIKINLEQNHFKLREFILW